MGYFLTYWVIGCVIAGLAMAAGFRKCPTYNPDASELFVSVAVWPALIVTVVALPSDFKFPERECKAPR